MSHLKKIHIKGFRGLRKANLPELTSINIFVGNNNSGKTSMLEAIELHCNPLDLRALLNVARGRDRNLMMHRSLPLLDSVMWLFPVVKDMEGKIVSIEDVEHESIEISSAFLGNDHFVTKACYSEKSLVDFNEDQLQEDKISGNYSISDNEEGRALEVELFCNRPHYVYGTPPKELEHPGSKTFILTEKFRYLQEKRKEPLLQTNVVTPVDHRVLPVLVKSLTDTIMSGDKNNVISLLQSFDENITCVEVLSPDGQIPVTYLKHKKLGYAPLSSFGDGIRRVITMAQAILRSKNGILLIDEIETAVHVGLFEKIFPWIVESCLTYNIQLFATTHSIEALDSMISIDDESLSHFMTYRIEQKENQTIAKKFKGEDLYELRQTFGQDVR